MSLSDTAALVSSLELKDKFTPTVNKFDKSISALERRSSSFSKIGGHVGQGISSAVANLTKLAVVGAAAIGSQVKFGIDALQRLEEVTAQTNAVLRSTGGVAGQTAASIRDLASKYEDLNATIDDKVIQSGENLLLTFTSIRKDAFEPALRAALDLNQALGGGEEGLQGVIIQVGKALQDPVRGLTALRRVGVAFSADQEKQIKYLVKHNKLYEAQQIILAELTKEFGGSFAAAGKTATGTFASLGDAVEDLQMNLATALLPALADVAKEVNAFLRDPATVRGVKDFGKGLAGAFKDAVAFAKQVPWKAIGDGLRTAAGAAKGLIDAFVKAPDWLKTAVITGWGLNKLTGGAVTNIFGDVLKGIGGQFLTRGASAANPLWVTSVTGGIGGVGGVGGKTGGLLGALGSIVMKVSIIGMVAEVADLIHGAISPGGGLEGRTQGLGGGLLPGDKLAWPFGPKDTPHIDLGPFKNILGGDSTFSAPLSPALASIVGGSAGSGYGGGNSGGGGGGAIGAIGDPLGPAGGGAASRGWTAGMKPWVDAVKANTAALKTSSAITKDQSWLKNLKEGIAERSAKKYGGKGLGEAAVTATYQRDVLGRAASIMKSGASSEAKLERMKALLKGAKDATDATKRTLSGDLKVLTSKVKNQKIPSVTVNIGTNIEVSANAVVTTYKSTQSYGPSDPDHKHDRVL